jgi:long-chain acyl-CoA synthetase
MEASTAETPERSTGSKTIADLAGRAAQRYGDAVAGRVKRDGAWQDTTYAEVGAAVSEIGRGLIALGIEPGDRVCLLAGTRIEWTLCDFAIAAAGAVVVPIYPTNSPEECEWVVGNSEARAVICEDAAQLAKIESVRDRLPALEHLLVIDAGDDTAVAVGLDALRARGRDLEPERLDERIRAVGSDDPFTFIYTSGTTGPPKGCVLTHGNYRGVLDMCLSAASFDEDEVVYLYLPLAHSYALLIQLLSFDLGNTIAYWGGDPKQIILELTEVRPTYLPSVPRIFEKIYTLVTGNVEPEKLRRAVGVGLAVRELEARGEPVPEELRTAFAAADDELFSKVRAAFGGRMRQAVTGAAPIARDILEFFYACGAPVLEGYGMTETATVATHSTIEDHRFGTVGRPLPGCEVKIANDGEVLIRGANIFHGYYKDAEKSFGAIEDGWLHTGDLGSLDADGYLSITGRKKDIIITAGGKNITPSNLENDLKASRWISQAVMHGDRRPYPVALITLDEEEIVPWAEQQGLPTDIPALSREPRVRALVGDVVDEVNARYAQVEQIKRFAILDHDLSQASGELTPTLKVKRNVVAEKFGDVFESLYTG